MTYLLLEYTPVQKFMKWSIYTQDHRFDVKKTKKKKKKSFVLYF